MPRKDGKELEELVAEIEKIAAREGKAVEVNKLLYDDKGTPVAEFDILITYSSKLGEHRWLIECRDRPSQGSAPGSWIEQLIGRKILHELDRVIAVSTMNFSPGAIHWASKGGIELRTVKEAEIPEKWLCNVVTLLNRTGNFNGCKVNLLNGLDKEFTNNVEKNMPHNADDIIIHFENLDTRLSPRELFQNLCFDEKNAIYKDVPPGKSKSIHLVCSPNMQTTGAMFMEFSNFRVPLENIELSGVVEIEMNTVPFEQTKVYRRNDNQTLVGQRVTCLFETDKEIMKFHFYDVEVEEGRQIAIKADKEPKS